MTSQNRHTPENTAGAIDPVPTAPAKMCDEARETIQKRLDNLRSEFAAGQKMLTDLDAKRGSLTETLLRISGAIQVLEEMTKE